MCIGLGGVTALEGYLPNERLPAKNGNIARVRWVHWVRYDCPGYAPDLRAVAAVTAGNF